MADKEKRLRRSKKEVLTTKVIEIDAKIVDFTTKISSLKEQKEQILSEIKIIEEKEAKAAEEAQNKEIINLIRKKGLSLDEVRNLLETKEEQ